MFNWIQCYEMKLYLIVANFFKTGVVIVERNETSIDNNNTVMYIITKKIRDDILNGKLKKGDRLIQEEWASKLGVSRMPIREALRQLELEGLVKIEPHKGAIVTPITMEDIEELFHTRSLLESIAAEKSLPYLTEKDIEEIECILQEMESLNIGIENIEYYIQMHDKFHKSIRKGCPWKRVNNLVDRTGISLIAPSLLVEHFSETQRDHRLIYEAIKKKSASELRLAIEYHILRTKNSLLTYMRKLNSTH